MSQLEKLKQRIKKIPKDFTYNEAKNLLMSLGFREYNKGKTSGSRVMFFREEDKAIIMLHKPHPGNEMPTYAVKDIVKYLKEIGELI